MKTFILFCIFFYLNHLIQAESEEEALSRFVVKDGFILWARSNFRLRGVSPGYCALKCLSLGDRCQSFDYNVRHRSCFGRSQGSDIFSDSRHHQRRYSLRHQNGYQLFVKSSSDDGRDFEEDREIRKENATQNELEVEKISKNIKVTEATKEPKINKQTTIITEATTRKRTRRPQKTTTEATTTTRRTRRPKITTQTATAIPTDRPTTTKPTTTKSTTTSEPTTIKSTATESTTTKSTTAKPTTTKPTTTKSTTTKPTTIKSTTTEPTTTQSTTTTTQSTTTEPTTTTKSTTTELTTKLTTTTRKTRRTKRPRTLKPTTTKATTKATILSNNNRGGSCFQPLGMESGEILDSDIDASTNYLFNYASKARLNSQTYWMPSTNDNQQFLRINLQKSTLISRIGIQGLDVWYTSGYVTSYKIEFQLDEDSEFQLYEDSFGISEIKGSSNGSDEALYEFKPSFEAISIKIIPISWYKNIALRVELYTSTC